jgi:hypothetical protein
MKHVDRSGRMAPRGTGHSAARPLVRPMASAAILAAIVAAGIAVPPLAAATSGRDRLAVDLETLTKQQIAGNKVIPDSDKPRTAQCLAKAITTDIPDADAGKLSDMFNRRLAFDKALEVKWLTIGHQEAPARYQQVINAVQKLCPDLAPYVEPMF